MKKIRTDFPRKLVLQKVALLDLSDQQRVAGGLRATNPRVHTCIDCLPFTLEETCRICTSVVILCQ